MLPLAVAAALLPAFVVSPPARAGEAAPSCGPLAPSEVDRPRAPVISCRRGWLRALAGTAPVGWTDRRFDDSTWTTASGFVTPRSLTPRQDDSTAAPAPLALTPEDRLFLRRRFDLAADEHGKLSQIPRVIELRVSYLDGFVAYLNGGEIARRNLSDGRPAGRPALPHGREPERIFIPVTGSTPLRVKDNVLALEVRAALGRHGSGATAPAASLDIEVSAATRIVRGPYLIAPVEGTMTVAWETDLPATGTVELVPDQQAPALPAPAPVAPAAPTVVRTRAPQPASRQTVRLSGLRPGVVYRYRVIADVARGATANVRGDVLEPWAASAWASFTAPPEPTAPLRFVVYGDMRAPGHAAHAQVVAGIVRERPALVLCTGDLVAIGSDESAWQKYFDITAPLGAVAPIVPAFGNHETYWHGTGVAKAWGLFGLDSPRRAPGYASFDWGGAHFVVLDSNRFDSAQRDWLTRDLDAAATRHPRATFAICHDGPWSHGVHGSSRAMQRELAPILARAGVDVLFSGHDHLYERGIGATPVGPLPYIVTGGGGAPLYERNCHVPGAPGAAMTAATVTAAPPPEPTGAGDAGPADAAAVPAVSARVQSFTRHAWTGHACPKSVANIVKTYHYVVVEVDARTLRLCPRLPDGSPVEPCVEAPLREGPTRAP